ncbi:hypothetical protein SAMN05720468_10530 [Fibrobacter sp. UWEL]|nr:hypothetical protein SAMN05720468_10530 [Fibrobacter sp. UWEL]
MDKAQGSIMKFLFSAVSLIVICVITTSCGVYCFEDEEKDKEELDLKHKICYEDDKIDTCIKDHETIAFTEETDIRSYCKEKYSYKCEDELPD